MNDEKFSDLEQLAIKTSQNLVVLVDNFDKYVSLSTTVIQAFDKRIKELELAVSQLQNIILERLHAVH